MKKNDLQKSKQETGEKNQDEQDNQRFNVSNNQQGLQAGLGRDRMKDSEDWDGANSNTAQNFDDLRNENLNAANDE
jgi:hypothetical protein